MTVIRTRGMVSPASNPVIAFLSALRETSRCYFSLLQSSHHFCSPLSSMLETGSLNLNVFFTLFLTQPRDSLNLYICPLAECSKTFQLISKMCNTCPKKTTFCSKSPGSWYQFPLRRRQIFQERQISLLSLRIVASIYLLTPDNDHDEKGEVRLLDSEIL